MKYCKFCGAQVDDNVIICTKCGKQIEEIKTSTTETPNIIINNTNTNSNINNNIPVGAMKNKWVAFFLCLFFGYLGVHRFYERKIGTGILWLCTFGLCGFGWIIDLIIILTKPAHYYVHY